jgi:hypothetical protein
LPRGALICEQIPDLLPNQSNSLAKSALSLANPLSGEEKLAPITAQAFQRDKYFKVLIYWPGTERAAVAQKSNWRKTLKLLALLLLLRWFGLSSERVVKIVKTFRLKICGIKN